MEQEHPGAPSIPDDRVSRGLGRVTSGPRSLLSARRSTCYLAISFENTRRRGSLSFAINRPFLLVPHFPYAGFRPPFQALMFSQYMAPNFAERCSMSLDLSSHVIATSTSPHDSHVNFGIKTPSIQMGLNLSNARVKCCGSRMFSPLCSAYVCIWYGNGLGRAQVEPKNGAANFHRVY